MALHRRLRRQTDRHALVDGIPFTLPGAAVDRPACMVAFPVNAQRVAELPLGAGLAAVTGSASRSVIPHAGPGRTAISHRRNS